MNQAIEAEYRLTERSIRGRSYRDFEKNFDRLNQIFGCFNEFGSRDFVVADGERLTYAQFRARAASLAEGLSQDYQVMPGSRVALAYPNSVEWMLSFTSLVSLGAVPVLINARAADDELGYCMASTGCRLLLGDRAAPSISGPSIPSQQARSLATRMSDSTLPRAARSGDDEAILMFTSGTTGRPKAAILTKQGVLTSLKTIQYSGALIAAQMARKYNIDYETLISMRPPPVTLLVFPLFHVSGCHAVFLSGMMQGGKLVLLPRWDATEALQLIEREKVTAFPGVPTMYWDLLHNEQRSSFDLSGITSLSVGGQATPPSLLKAIQTAFPGAVPGSGYGMTEANGTVTLAIGEDFLANPASVGKMVATFDGEIRDASGATLPAGEVGEIFVRGASLMAGYANHDAQVIDEQGWFATGDAGYFDAEGNLYIVDRLTDMVISGGENIYCAEVERVLDTHPEVTECAAFGIPDERLGEKLAAVAVVSDAAGVNPEELLTHCADHLAGYKVPKALYLQTAGLPRNATGKLLKRKIRAQFEASPPTA